MEIKTLKKEELVKFFKEWCADEKNNLIRKNSVEKQQQVNVWQITAESLLIQIYNGKPPQIAVATLTENISKFTVFDLPEQEFSELYNLYKGDYSFDYEFAKKMEEDFKKRTS